MSGTGVGVIRIGVPESPVLQGKISEQLFRCGMDATAINRILVEKGAALL